MNDAIPTDYRLRLQDSLVGAQMLLVAFGALVLVPLLTGLDPNVALFTAGAGTLLFQVCTGGQVPVFLASSFAFIAPIIYATQTFGIPATLGGLMAVGVVYLVLSALIALRGVELLHRILPSVVVGPVIMVIGLLLAPVAINMATGQTGDGSTQLVPVALALPVATVALGTTIYFALRGRGLLRIVPILLGIAAGYGVSLVLSLAGFGEGLINFTPVLEAPWLAVPAFTAPAFDLQAILYMLPVALAPAVEHFGDILAIGGVTNRDYFDRPGIHRTMLGDGLATSLAAGLGGPPNTTYSEVTGAVALTRVFNPAVMTWAALAAILLAFVGKLGAFLQTIPIPVMGGILVLLFGSIVVIGLKTLVALGEQVAEPRNLAIIATSLICGIGGMALNLGPFHLEGIGLAAVLAVGLNLILPGHRAVWTEANPNADADKAPGE
ncbi:MAG: uracil-xanthine permease family protein [Candidatus Competibacteraceae bacterium]|nr:uracil-xanthine permease family protein [Candidatus Competibacteraceae bacterium]